MAGSSDLLRNCPFAATLSAVPPDCSFQPILDMMPIRGMIPESHDNSDDQRNDDHHRRLNGGKDPACTAFRIFLIMRSDKKPVPYQCFPLQKKRSLTGAKRAEDLCFCHCPEKLPLHTADCGSGRFFFDLRIIHDMSRDLQTAVRIRSSLACAI